MQHLSEDVVSEQNLIIKNIIDVMHQEADVIKSATKHISQTASLLVELIFNTKGKIVFCGAGKSGLIGQKLAATYASLGIPAIFLHPSDAIHGSLGVVQPNDIFIALSKSGTGSELEQIVPYLHVHNVRFCLICCVQGALAQKAHLVVCLPCEREACSLNLAPTNSSTLMLAFGDAVAVTISKLKGFSKNNFAIYHPAGALGRKLLTTTHSFMHKKNELPLLKADTQFKDLLFSITNKKLGIGIVVNDKNELLGIITDGDLRRACSSGPDVFNSTASQIMTKNPKSISSNQLACNALELMEEHNITSLVVTDNNAVTGLVHIHDLIKAGLKA